MKPYVINLPRAENRRKAMAEQLQGLGLEFEFLPGTDWKQLSEEDWLQVDRAGRAWEGRSPLSPGMVACHLSHRKALAAIATGDKEWGAVLEDDVALATELKAALLALDASPEARHFDIIFLHRNRTDKAFVPLVPIGNRWRLGMVRFCDWGAQAYAVSRKGARKLLDRYPRIVHRNDHTLHAYWESGLRTAYLDPPAASHGTADAEKSLLQEGSRRRKGRSILSVPRRIRSMAVEEFRKRRSFYRRTRSGIQS